MIPIKLGSNIEINSKQISIIFRFKEELKTKGQKVWMLAQDNSCA
jgi:hypothetical protein